jgi:hypothetical protein
MHAMSDAWGAASPTTSHKQHSHLLSGMYSAASSHQHVLHLHAAHHQQQHMHSSSPLSSPAAHAAAAGAAAAASGAFTSPLRSCAWAGSSAGAHSSEPQQQQQEQEQQQEPTSAAAAAAAAIHSTGRWSQHNEGPLPLDVTHEDEADLARLFDGDSDVAMASAPAVPAAPSTAAAAAAAGACNSPMVGSGGGAVPEAAAHDCAAKLESLIEELQTGAAAPSSRLGSAPLNEVAGELLALPAWGSSSSGSLDHILSPDCW